VNFAMVTAVAQRTTEGTLTIPVKAGLGLQLQVSVPLRSPISPRPRNRAWEAVPFADGPLFQFTAYLTSTKLAGKV
jgi:hypothetical protein